MTKYTEEVKSNVLKQYQEGTPILLIIQNTDIPRSTIYHWIKNPPLSKKEETAKTIRFLSSSRAIQCTYAMRSFGRFPRDIL